MGSSAKKRKEKKKDFQKPKLKVGKPAPKPANFTDTSFKAGAIKLSHQNIAVEVPSTAANVTHHVARLRHANARDRATSLAALAALIGEEQRGTIEGAEILQKTCPLMMDPNSGVRQGVLKVLQRTDAEDMRGQEDLLRSYITAAMMHMASEVSLSSMDVLKAVLEKIGTEFVESAGGWYRMLNCFVTLLGWQKPQENVKGGWSQVQGDAKQGVQGKALARQLDSLGRFVKAGIGSSRKEKNGLIDTREYFPFIDFKNHLISDRRDPYGKLNLFGQHSNNPDDRMIEDRQERQEIFVQVFEDLLLDGIEGVKRHGGEVGRAAAALAKVIETCLSDFDRENFAERPTLIQRLGAVTHTNDG